jgi:hypothetical protein
VGGGKIKIPVLGRGQIHVSLSWVQNSLPERSVWLRFQNRIVILTHQRPEELKATLTAILSTKIPSLLEVVVVWNNIGEATPEPYTSEHGVSVRYRAASRNSLNEKVLPDPNYLTQAILLSDDDVHYEPDDLEFVFRSWRKYGRNRIAGALARCHNKGEQGSWEYGGCKQDDVYSMILTNLAFVHISFLDYYSSNDPVMKKVRAYVDEHFNCEDIAMNFLVSQLTCEGPMQVFGKKRYSNAEPQIGISMKPGHMEARTQCLNDLTKMFGHMPLINQESRLVRGPFLSN